MNHSTPHQTRRRCAGGRRDDRGSAIVLVLVSMVLMAILAGSLLQLTRFERIPQSESNIEVVIESVVAEILNAATEDVLDDNGNFLNTGNVAAGGGDEPWDFPWTNPDTTLGRTVEYDNGTTINPNFPVYGGAMDDSWLADGVPDFRVPIPARSIFNGSQTSATDGIWQKITNLTGMYLGGDANADADLSLNAKPTEFPVNNLGNPNNRDTDFFTSSARLVDADGDGIGDSRWEWAPLRQVGATKYVFAARIIDLSARANFNVILGPTAASGGSVDPTSYQPTSANLNAEPRGDAPTELDGPAFIELITLGDSTAPVNVTAQHLEWRQAVGYRFNGNLTSTAAASIAYDGDAVTPTAGSRTDYWNRGASRVSNGLDYNGIAGSATFGFQDAFELLQGNGLNSPQNTTLENLMPTLLRRDNVSGGNSQEDNYAGTTTAITNNNNQSWDKLAFWTLDPRKYITLFSGSSIAAKPGATASARLLKVDVNRATEQNRVGQISTAINRIADGNLAALYDHLADDQDLSDQLAVNIADYIDDDNEVRTVNGKTGFEALPFITEVYTQRVYDGTVTVNNTDRAMSTISWSAPAGHAIGYVIEIGNPFGRDAGTNDWRGRPVDLRNVFLAINGTFATGTADLATLVGQNFLQPGEVVHLYRNSTGNTAANGTTEDDLSDFTTSYTNNTAANLTRVNLQAGQAGLMPVMPTATATFDVTLHAAAQGDTTPILGWAYSACRVTVAEAAPAGLANMPFDATHHDDVANTVYQSYLQTSHRGVGEGLQMMTVAALQTEANSYHEDLTTFADPEVRTVLPVMTPNAANVGQASRTLQTSMLNESKPDAPTGFGNLDGQQIVWQDSKRANGTALGRMHWIGDVLQIPVIGPNDTDAADKSMANAFFRAGNNTTTLSNATTGNGVDRLLLPYKSDATSTYLGADSLNYPQSLLILEQLTTFNPATDGEDGDGQSDSGSENVTADGSADDDDEVLVPGRLNLNTASRGTLISLLPFPDLNTRQTVADAIITRRERTNRAAAFTPAAPNTTGYGMGMNGIPGIAYTTGLYEQLSAETNVNPAGDTTTLLTSGVRVDLNDYEDALRDYDPLTAGAQYPGLADGVVNDREEEIMLAKWLTEVADTRSDVFAAYIVVQGYPADDFTAGASESARLIIIFSRANVKQLGDRAVELDRFWVQRP
ncbi:MAG: hypothetical protein AAGB26_06805 [Planctomycetota bacterium]